MVRKFDVWLWMILLIRVLFVLVLWVVIRVWMENICSVLWIDRVFFVEFFWLLNG